MRFIADHDYHIHSQLSSCSSDAEQSTARILQYAEQNHFSAICLTDHCWDETVPGASDWYKPQNIAHLEQALPLPQGDTTHFYFGCETEMDKHFTIGMNRLERFDFVIVPTTHMHMEGFTREKEDYQIPRLSELYLARIQALLSKPMPFHKMGLAHLSCSHLANRNFEDHLMVLDQVSDSAFTDLFTQIAQKGLGVELNFRVEAYANMDLPRVLRPYRIARRCGCKFYLGSDAHHPKQLDTARENFEQIIDLLQLTEAEKFHPFAD